MIQSIIGTSFTGGGYKPPPPSTPTFVASNYNTIEDTTITFTISGITGVSEGTYLYWWIDGTSPSSSRADQFVENIDNSTLQLYTDGSGTLGGTFTLTPNQGSISFNIYIGYSLYGGFLPLPQNIIVNNVVNDFTIEWWQKMTSSVSNYDRLFDVGYNPTESIGFSEELTFNRLIIWTGSQNTTLPHNISSLYNTWIHFAIVRDNNEVELYKNGTRILYNSNSSLILNNTSDLEIGGGSGQKFNGYLTNFHFLKGVVKYNGDFTPSTIPLNPADYLQTKLLLSVTSSNTTFIDSTGNHVASVIGGTWSSESPFSDGSGSIYFDGVSTYLNFPGSDDWAIDKPYELALTFDNIVNVNFINNPNSVSDWNTLFNLPNLGKAFDSVQVNGNVVTLIGGRNIGLNSSLNGNTNLLSVADTGCITSLGVSCFKNCTSVTTFDLPSVTTTANSINNNGCFGNCTSVTTFNLPNLTTAGDYTFQDCRVLTNLNLPKLTTAGNGCFVNLYNLTNLNLPKLTTAGNLCFANLYNLTNLNLPLLESIGTYGFAGVGNQGTLGTLTLNLPSLISMGDGALYGMTKLTTLNLPSLVNLGTTTGYDGIFEFMFNSGERAVSITLPSTLMTDGDITDLLQNHTMVTITQV